jgi:membrane protease YdiL (CAAX protease family)
LADRSYLAGVMTDSPGEGIPPKIEPVTGPDGPALLVARWRWWFHLLILGGYPLVIGGMAFLGPTRTEPALTSTVGGLLTISAMEMLVFGAVFALAWLASRANRAQLLMAERLHLRDIPLSIAYSVGLRIAIMIVGAVIAGALVLSGALSMDRIEEFVRANRPDVESLVDISALQDNPLYLFVNATLVSFVVAGFREELWRAGVLAGFAALWPSRFGSTKGQLLAVAIAAVLFGIGHFSQGALAVVMTAVLGFLLGVIMVFHRSIWPAVLAHGAFNATSFLVLPLVGEYL